MPVDPPSKIEKITKLSFSYNQPVKVKVTLLANNISQEISRMSLGIIVLHAKNLHLKDASMSCQELAYSVLVFCLKPLAVVEPSEKALLKPLNRLSSIFLFSIMCLVTAISGWNSVRSYLSLADQIRGSAIT